MEGFTVQDVIEKVERVILPLIPPGESEEDLPLLLTKTDEKTADELARGVNIFKHSKFDKFVSEYSSKVAEYFSIDRERLIEDVRQLHVEYYGDEKLEDIVDVMDVAYAVLRQLSERGEFGDSATVMKLGRTLALVLRGDFIVKGFKNDVLVIIPSDPDSHVFEVDYVLAHGNRYGASPVIVSGETVRGKLPYDGEMSRVGEVDGVLDYVRKVIKVEFFINPARTKKWLSDLVKELEENEKRFKTARKMAENGEFSLSD